ncbi:putative transcription factor (Snd1/p100) [Aspergillus clavatus NRRL 1]|uniref:Probable endonuclease LCL3 n=1 Tax=Aspergillus clavatus (strain ATCC 1007 / CBS 513.65 / DSM 816 / NCTC 3887 / NRRL 1 / QM 1276 / 107) TaxID=344612 RepID=A1CAD7_ASPCL|nr:transcription factor (Snd1/p100), putative [Aspergillus clavatus NRRL 1]EAW12705.1 transcription factor (Snd1/p100), putative [Aspergillus clavatus NRRL 1]
MPLEARVKSVLSGDTVVLSNLANGQERLLSLAYVSAPRLKREGDETDTQLSHHPSLFNPCYHYLRSGSILVYIEDVVVDCRSPIFSQPYGFHSREFLREVLVGKVINFQILYTIPTGAKREYGTIKLPGFDASLPDISVQEGWARVREEAGKRDESEETASYLERLRALEDHARTESKGLWAGAENGRTETSYELTDGRALVDEWKEKHLEAIVERVLNGDRLVLRLLLSPEKHLQTVVAVGGVRAPAARRVNAEGKEQPGEPFGDEAYQFVESRLLQRKVQVSLLGVTPQGQLIATVLHPNGNIAKFLLEAGLARCFDHHSALLGPEMVSFRRAEKEAKDNRKGLFTGFASKGPAGGAAELDYIVSRVLNADTLFLRNKAGEEKKISLSSVRQPKPSDPKQAPFQADAKEFVRKRLIGKHVKVTINGKKPANEGYEERDVATVVQGNTNIALALVEAGYASVIRHRQDDDDRSPEYDSLLLAEAEAQKDGKGMWSPKPPKPKQYQDYSENVQKAKLEVSVLQRQKRVPAIVDFVKSGSRFTVLVPRENAKLTLVLGGIRAPRSARSPGEASEPFGQEAHDLANRRCMQRDVEIDIQTHDKVGGFIGTLYVNKEDFAKVLLEEGLATVHAYSAEQSGRANEYFAAEKKAKDARKGLWHDWDPSKEAAEAEVEPVNGAETEAVERRKDYRDVMVTYVDPTSARIKIQQIGTGTSALTELMSAFRSFHLNKANDTPLPGPPKAGEYVAAKFSEDGDWYRARVRRNDREKQQAEVLYIDYGNSEVLPWSRLRPLSQPQFSVQKLRAQAVDAVFSFLQFPVSADYLQDAVSFIGELTYDRTLVANVDYVAADGLMHVTLLDPSVSKNLDQSINAEIVREGLAMVPRKLKAWERAASDTLSHLRSVEDQAKQERRGMWEYGDLTED